MHYLQKGILDRLRYEQPLTYTALMPDGLESSHFRYHLKLLMTDKLVVKDNNGHYRLSDAGQREVDYLSTNRVTSVRTPKVITYTLLIYGQQIVLYKKPKEPYRHLWGLIGGKVHFGEAIRASAQREVFEKTGLQVPLPTLRGVADIIIEKDGEPLSHVTAYVHSCVLDNLPQTLPPELAVIDYATVKQHLVIPDLPPLLEALQPNNKFFFKQLRCRLV